MRNKPQVGQRVRYSHAWLKSVGAYDDLGWIRATITYVGKKIGKGYYVKMLLDGDTEPIGCLSSNLTQIDFDVTE